MKISCPHCGSKSVKSSRAVYEQGTSNTRSVSHMGWISNRGSGGSRRQGKSTRQSVAASRNAPAGRKLEVLIFVASFLLSAWLILDIPATTVLGSVIAGAIIALLITALVAHLNRRYWCGSVFHPQWLCYHALCIAHGYWIRFSGRVPEAPCVAPAASLFHSAADLLSVKRSNGDVSLC